LAKTVILKVKTLVLAVCGHTASQNVVPVVAAINIVPVAATANN